MGLITNMFLSSVASAFAISVLVPQTSLSKFAWTAIVFLYQVLAYLLYSLVLWPRFFSPLRHLPGAPGGKFFTGHMGQIVKESSGYPMRRWIETVPNNGMIRYSMWFKERVLITQPSMLAEVLVTKSYDFIKPSHIRLGLSRLLGVGILLAEGDDHKAQRKTLMPAFAFRHVKNLYPLFWGKAKELVDCLDEASKSTQPTPVAGSKTNEKHEAGVIEVNKWASRATLDIIGLSGMGRDFDSLHNPDNKLNKAYHTMFNRPSRMAFLLQLSALFIPGQIVNAIPLKYNVDLDGSVAYVREVCQDLISKKRQSLGKGEQSDIDILSIAIECGGFTDTQLIDQMMTFLAAGHETTATAMAAAMVLLCRHLEVQSKLRAEIRAAIPSPSSTITPSDIDDCHYLQAVCSEVLRIWSPVSMTFRVAEVDTSIGDTFIPKGTTLCLSPWAVNASTQLWGEDAQKFKPERWLDANGHANHQGSASSNYSFLTFLHGPRSCIGQRFAQAEFACLLAAWVGSFETKFETGSRLYEDDGDMVGGVTNKPKGGVWCTLERMPGWE